ncbi:DUF4037 domain-containing protein [Streptosporangiaceae bacterium NEAU-GS5]|nr:DUF4037 domain-containing protein [Streptosporangiaceae bacterium NEAU-GS5]
MTARFVPGLQLSAAFYEKVMAPALRGVPHSSALIGPGSEVLSFDTERSADHDWGPRALVFVDGEAVDEARERLLARLPATFRGFPTSFGSDRNPVQPGVRVEEFTGWACGRLGFDPLGDITLLDWLGTPTQLLAEFTGGAVFHDGLGVLAGARTRLRWYPDDVWRYVLACQWTRIGQEEPFPGRCAEVGDGIGSALVTARLVRDLMRLTLLMRRRYPPYSKWLGSAFARLSGTAELRDTLAAALAAPTWPQREDQLCRAYQATAALHNRLMLTVPMDPGVRAFHGRPFRVLDAGRFATALMDGVRDPRIRALTPVGAVDQFADSTDLLSHPQHARGAARAVHC